ENEDAAYVCGVLTIHGNDIGRTVDTGVVRVRAGGVYSPVMTVCVVNTARLYKIGGPELPIALLQFREQPCIAILVAAPMWVATSVLGCMFLQLDAERL